MPDNVEADIRKLHINMAAFVNRFDDEVERACRLTAEQIQQLARLNAPINKIGASDTVGGAKTMYFDYVNNVPAYRGRLKNSVEHEKDDSAAGRRKHRWIVRAGGKPKFSNRPDDIYYAIFVHEGTRRIKKRPFITEAAKAKKEYFYSAIRVAVRRALTMHLPYKPR